MQISRRAFTGGTLSAAAALQLPGRALGQAAAQAPAALAPAIAAIRAYGDAHRDYFGLPGMTLGLTTPGGFSTVLNFGYANADARTPITPDTLFQIGSISKEMTAAVIHQLAAAGRFKLSDRFSALMPDIPLPAGNAITVQHVLDHVAGLPDDAPLFPAGGLWTASAPGAHWHYSNTGYDMLGKLAAHAGGAPLDQLIEQRILKPLGMTRSRGAIVAADRLRYAQGYEAADRNVAYARGLSLAPAAWVDVTFGAGSVASTAADMNLFMRSLADAANGRGGLGLSADQARVFTGHAVPSDTPGMNYGNGLMHVGGAGRSYLHHTGGMVSFSSSFHLDAKSGVGAFASASLSAFAEYRPRLLTRFAVDALTNALAGAALPATASLAIHLPGASMYVGRYSGPSGKFEIKAGSPLTLVANGRSAALEPIGGDMFRTLHPDFSRFTLAFDRRNGAIAGAVWGPASYARDGSDGTLPASDPALARFVGRYINDSPWVGLADVVERGGKLWIGTETPMTRVSDNLWRVGEESWSPERASFANAIDGRPQSFFYSGVEFIRHDI
jgi:CubicO group peptidase (beta-lactamase class C family)